MKRPEAPVLEPGRRYLLEVVLRTVGVGNLFTEGTADSNQVWIELIARQGDRIIGHSGSMDEQGKVDPWAYFVNAYVLDHQAERIDRRNAQDILTPLYNHQIPPGAADVVHYALDLPEDITGPPTLVEQPLHLVQSVELCLVVEALTILRPDRPRKSIAAFPLAQRCGADPQLCRCQSDFQVIRHGPGFFRYFSTFVQCKVRQHIRPIS